MALWSNTDAAASKPKYLTTADKNATLGVSVDEAQDSGNKAKGLNTPGWVKYSTYTDAQGATRHKSEVLVAMSTITGDNDTIDPDPVITIGTQPTGFTLAQSGDTGTLSVVATATRSATLSYQWQQLNEGVWENINEATTSSLEFSWALPAGSTDYRVIVSATGATSVTSSVATVTVTE